MYGVPRFCQLMTVGVAFLFYWCNFQRTEKSIFFRCRSVFLHDKREPYRDSASPVVAFFVCIPHRLRTRKMASFILRYRTVPTIPVTIPMGMHTIPTIQNQRSCAKWMIETPAINMATAERKYAKRVLSFAKIVRSIASSSLNIRSSLSNREYGESFISSFFPPNLNSLA